MMDSVTLRAHDDRFIYVVYQYTLSDEPKVAQSWYPIGTGYGSAQFSAYDLTRNYGDEKLGQPLHAIGNGCYEDRDKLRYTLTEGAQTKAKYWGTTAVEEPKVRKGIRVRWNNGWEKYLKTQGWVSA